MYKSLIAGLCITISFNILKGAILLNESFENGVPPDGWIMIDAGTHSNDTWEQSSSKKRTGNYSATVQYGPTGTFQNEWLITPAIDLTGAQNPKLIFYEDEEWWSGYGYKHLIKISTTSQNDTTSFVTILEMTPSNHQVPGFDGDSIEIDLSAYVGQTIYIAFVYLGEYADNWYIDDVKVFYVSQHDVGVSKIIAPDEHEDPGISFNPTVIVRNAGLNTESFNVYAVIDSAGTIIYQDMVQVNNLPSFGVDTVVFSSVTLNAPDFVYNFKTYTQLSGDEDPENDTLSLYVNTYTTPKKVFCELITNTGCGPCAPANDTLTHIIIDYPNDIVCIRYHAWWPSSSDPFYQANPTENSARINYYGSDYTPHLWINGDIDGQYLKDDWRDMILSQMDEYSPVSIELSATFDPGTGDGQVQAKIKAKGQPLWTDAKLRYAIVEDSIYYNAPNGENWHFQVFRDMFPNTNGVPISLNQGDSLIDVQNFSIDPSWNYEFCWIVVFIQDDVEHSVVQCEKLSIGELSISENTGYNDIYFIAPPSIIKDNIVFILNTEDEKGIFIELFNAAGRKVFYKKISLVRGVNKITIDSKVLRSKGVYFYKINGKQDFEGKIIYMGK